MLLFVYGNFKAGYHHNFILKDSEFKGACLTECNDYNMYDMGGFPGIVLSLEPGFKIMGELYKVDEKTMSRVDWIAHVPHWFKRTIVPVMWTGIPCFAYTHILSHTFVEGRQEIPEDMYLEGIKSWNPAT